MIDLLNFGAKNCKIWLQIEKPLMLNFEVSGGGSTSKILKENLKIFDFYAVLFRKLKNQKSAILRPIFLKLFRNLSTGTSLLYKNSPTETLKDINIQDRDWNGCPW